MMPTVLLTGGAGFFGGVLKHRLLDAGYTCVSVDLQPDDTRRDHFTAWQIDIRNKAAMEALFAEHRFDAVLHCAAILAHDVRDRKFLWTSNVDGTAVVADLSDAYGVRKVVFTSSNCLWAHPFDRPVSELDTPAPREIYGESKRVGEQILLDPRHRFSAIVIRTPTIIDAGRLGLLSILFEFID
jgi:nucleoside-diphosphate-sugar epimerase